MFTVERLIEPLLFSLFTDSKSRCFFYKKINEDDIGGQSMTSTSDIAIQPKPLFGDENNEMVEVLCRHCNTKNSISKKMS